MAVDNIARGLAASALKKGGVTPEQLEEGLAKKLDKVGGTVTGDLAIQGDLTVAGTTKSEKTKTLMVEDNVIVTNANKVALQALLSGLAINKDANATYGIMYDPADDTVKFGQGVLDKDGKFTFSEGEGKPLAIRAQSTELNEGHLIKWDSATNSFVDSGKTVMDFVEIQKDNLVNGNLLQWDADNNKIINAGKSTGDFLTMKRPVGVQTDFVQIVRSADGTVYQASATGVATVGPNNKAAYAPVLRGSAGQLTCHTAPEENQTDYDCVNRGELKEAQSKIADDYVQKVIDPSRYMIYCQRPSGIETNPGGIQMLEYSSSKLESTIAYRGENGVLKTKTAPESSQTETDCINRGELVSKLSNYEKSPNYVLIEKVITGYTVLEIAPEDFTTNYANYYKTNGKARNDMDFAYVALTEAETFEAGKYYSKAEATEFSQVERSSGVDGKAYSFGKMKIFAQNDVNKIRQWSWVHFHINNSDATFCLNYFNTSQTTTITDVNAYTDGNSAFTTSALLTSELYGTFNMVSNRLIYNDSNIKITKIKTGGLFPDTTLLIYGVEK